MQTLTRNTLRLSKPAGELRRVSPPAPKPLPVPPVPVAAGHFWFVWRTDGSRPRQRHATLEAAIAERDRLRELVPGAEFRVFEAREVTT